jgi:uncharacterized protein involved in outer membrane biogenesis
MALVVTLELLVESVVFQTQRGRVESELSRAVGLEVSIRGDFHLELIPRPTFEATEITVANLPGRPSPYLLEVAALELRFDAWDLLLGEVEIESLLFEKVTVHIEPDERGELDVEHDLPTLARGSPRGPVRFRIEQVRFEELDLFYRAGETGEVYSARLETLHLEAEDINRPIDLVAVGDVEGGHLDVKGSLGSLESLLEATRPYPVSLRGRVLEARIELEGAIAVPTKLEGVDVRLSARLARPGHFLREHGYPIPKVGPVHLSGRLSNHEGPFALEDLTLKTLSGSALNAELRGSVKNLGELQGVEIRLQLASDDAEFLEPVVQRDLPDVGLDASATLSDDDGSLGFEGEIHGGGPETPIAFDVVGGHDDLSQIGEIDVRASFRTRTLTVLGDVIGLEWELPALGPVKAKGRLHDHEGNLALDELDVVIGQRGGTWVELSGSILDLLAFERLALDAEFGAADLEHIRPYLQREPPDVGVIEGEGHLTDEDGTLGVERFTIRGGNPGDFTIEVSGQLDHVRELDEIEVNARVEARNLKVLGRVFDADLPAVGPVEFTGSVIGSDENLRSTGETRINRTEIRGESSAEFGSGARPSVTARFTSPHLYLDDLGVAPEHEPTARLPEVPAGVQSEQTDPFEQLRVFDTNITIHADRISGQAGFDLRDAEIRLDLEDGHLIVRHTGVAHDGGVEAELRVDARTPTPDFALRAEVEGLDLERLMSQFEDDTQFAGRVDLSADLRSRGESMQEILSTLSGRVRAVQRGGRLASRYGTNFIFSFARVSIPGFRETGAPRIGCILVDLEIDDGVATVDTMVLSAPKVTVTGSGTIDFVEDGFDLRLVPTVTDPGLLSVAATVRVSGPVESPEFRAVPRSLATSAAQAVLHNVMRPGRALVRPFRGGTEEALDFCGPGDPSVPARSEDGARSDLR